ncbi:MAG: hypothetical protein AAF514_00420, partial [Verrucomicrobiota bacterium]
MVRIGWLALLLWAFGLTAVPGLEAELRFTSLAFKAGSPVPVRMAIQSDTRGLLSGRVDFQTPTGYHFQTRTIHLQNGRQTVDFLLPPFDSEEDPLTSLTVSFIADGEKPVPLTEMMLPIEARDIIGVVEVEGIAELERTRSGGTPPWARFRPLKQDFNEEGGKRIRPRGARSRIPVERFPTDPHALLAYDLLFIDEASYPLLQPRALAALRRWVRAGGKIVVVAGPGLEEHHLQFLNLLPSEGSSMPFSLSSTGQLLGVKDFLTRRCELGRLVVVSQDFLARGGKMEPLLEFLWLDPATAQHSIG